MNEVVDSNIIERLKTELTYNANDKTILKDNEVVCSIATISPTDNDVWVIGNLNNYLNEAMSKQNVILKCDDVNVVVASYIKLIENGIVEAMNSNVQVKIIRYITKYSGGNQIIGTSGLEYAITRNLAKDEDESTEEVIILNNGDLRYKFEKWSEEVSKENFLLFSCLSMAGFAQ